jgi:hypothetical protein
MFGKPITAVLGASARPSARWGPVAGGQTFRLDDRLLGLPSELVDHVDECDKEPFAMGFWLRGEDRSVLSLYGGIPACEACAYVGFSNPSEFVANGGILFAGAHVRMRGCDSRGNAK